MFDQLSQLSLVLPDASWVTDLWRMGVRVLLMRSDHPEVLERKKRLQARQFHSKEIERLTAETVKATALEVDQQKAQLIRQEADAQIQLLQRGWLTTFDPDLGKLDIAARIKDWNVTRGEQPVPPTLDHALRVLGFRGAGILEAGIWSYKTQAEIDRMPEVERAAFLETKGIEVFDGKDGDGQQHFIPAFWPDRPQLNADGTPNEDARIKYGGQSAGDACRDWLRQASDDLAASRQKAMVTAADFFGDMGAGEPATSAG